MKKLETLYNAVRNVKCWSHFGKYLASSQNNKYSFHIYNLAISLEDIHQQKNISTQKPVCMFIASLFMITPKVEVNQIYINGQMNKQSMRYLHYRILWHVDACNNMDKLWEHCARWNKAVSNNTCCMIHLYEMSNICKSIETERRLVVIGLGIRLGVVDWLLVSIELLFTARETF